MKPMIGLLLKGADSEKIGPDKGPQGGDPYEGRVAAARAVMHALKKGDVNAFDEALHAYVECCDMEIGNSEDSEDDFVRR